MNQKISTKHLSSRERIEFWRAKVEEYKKSNESLVGFCKRENLCISPMRSWVHKFYPSKGPKLKSKANKSFIPVEVVSDQLKKDINLMGSKQSSHYRTPEWVGQMLAEVIRRLS